MAERSSPVADNPFGSAAGQGVVAAQENPQPMMTEHADPGAWSAAGSAVQQLGSAGEEVAQHYGQMATEAHVNDVLANQFAPAAAKLRADYYSKQGIDAVNAQPQYIASLTALRQGFLKDQSPLAQQMLGTYMARHAAQENDGSAFHADEQLTQYEDKTHGAMLATNSDNAVNNYNNPAVVDQMHSMNDGLIQKHGMDRGMSQEAIDETKRIAWGSTVKDAVGRAVTAGDVATASKIYNDNKSNIPGNEQLDVERLLHSEAMRQDGYNSFQAIKSGQPIPYGIGGQGAHEVQVATVNAAQARGVDPNEALTVAKIESNFGQNTGARGTIGQDKDSKGKSVAEQTQMLCDNYAKSGEQAKTALGRDPEPWEKYAVYQQGAGGGPALLKAATDNPMARAVDVLRPLYPSSKEALAAVVNNGGNATMTSGQFLDHIKQYYNSNMQRATCVLPPSAAPAVPTGEGQPVVQPLPAPKSLGDALNVPHTSTGLALQPGSSPAQTLRNFETSTPDWMARIQQIPNIDKREATMKAFDQEHQMLNVAAQAQEKVYNQRIDEFATNPKFTSVEQIPADIRAGFKDDPKAQTYLEERADYNLKHSENIVTADMSTNGSGYYNLLQNSSSLKVADLYQYTGKGGILTIPGFDKLKAEIESRKTPEGQAVGQAKDRLFAMGANVIYGQAMSYGVNDPKGEALHNKWLALVQNDYDRGVSGGKTPTQLLNPESPDYVGKSISMFLRSPEERLKEQFNTPRALDTVASDIQFGRMTKQQAQGEVPELIRNEYKAGRLSKAQAHNEMVRFGLLSEKPVPMVPRPE